TVTPAQLLERQQLAGDCAGGNRRRTGEPYLPRPGSPGKIAVDRTHRGLLRIGRGTGPAVGAGAACRLQKLGADLSESVEISAFDAIITHRSRAELQEQLDVRRNLQAARRCPGQHFMVAVEV